MLYQRLNGVLGVGVDDSREFVVSVLAAVDADASTCQNVQLVKHVQNLGCGLMNRRDDG